MFGVDISTVAGKLKMIVFSSVGRHTCAEIESNHTHKAMPIGGQLSRRQHRYTIRKRSTAIGRRLLAADCAQYTDRAECIGTLRRTAQRKSSPRATLCDSRRMGWDACVTRVCACV